MDFLKVYSFKHIIQIEIDNLENSENKLKGIKRINEQTILLQDLDQNLIFTKMKININKIQRTIY